MISLMKNKNIYLMYAIAFLQGMIFYGPIATLYRQAHGVSILQITIIESISLILCLLLEFPWGIIADKIGYKQTILFCCVLYFLSKIVFWQADRFSMFLLERIMLSVVIAGLSGVDSAFLYLSCQKEESLKVFGIYESLQTAGLLFAALVFSTFVGSNYPLAGLLTVISYGIAGLLALGLREVHRQETKSPNGQKILGLLKQVAKDRNLLLFLVGIALFQETHQTITVFLSQLQYTKCGLSPAAMGYIYILVTIIGLCSALSPKFTHKLGIPRFIFFLFFATTLSCLLLSFTESPWFSIAGILILRLAFSLFQPLQTELQNRRILTQNRATILSIYAVVIDSVGAGTNILFGMLANTSLEAALLLGAGLSIAGGFLVMRYVKK